MDRFDPLATWQAAEQHRARGDDAQARAAYERFGLNERQIELVGRATPKRHYYLQSRRGNRLFELGLGEVTLAFTAASS